MYTSDDDDQFVQHDKDNAVPVWSMLDSSNYKMSSDKKSYSSLSLSKSMFLLLVIINIYYI